MFMAEAVPAIAFIILILFVPESPRWLAMKGVHPDDELQVLPADFKLQETHVLKVPGCQGQRHLLILRRTI